MPFCPEKKNVRKKKLSGEKNCLKKKIVRKKKLSGQKKNVRRKKLSGQKKNVRTKNCPNKFFLSKLAMPLVFFSVHLALDFGLEEFLSIFLSGNSTKAWYFISEMFYSVLEIFWALKITIFLIKLLTKLPKISLKILSPKVFERLF